MSALEIVDLDLRARTRHARPLFDASTLSAAERAAVGASWKERMVSEYVSARVFAALVPQAMAAKVAYADVSRLSEMIAQEIEHAELCARVLRTLEDEPYAALPGDLQAVPHHADAEPLEALVRNVISVSCCSETVAVALVGTERELAATPELETLLTQILSDEVGHARFGWRLIEDLSPRFNSALRARLSGYLVGVFRHQLSIHTPFLTLPTVSDRAMSVGAPDGASSFRIFIETMTRVTIPGLDRLGIEATRAWDVALNEPAKVEE